MFFDVLSDLCSYYANVLEINIFLFLYKLTTSPSSCGHRRGGLGVDYSHLGPLTGVEYRFIRNFSKRSI